MLLLNMCNMLELFGLFVCLGGLKFFSAWGRQKKMLGCGLLGGPVPRLILCFHDTETSQLICSVNHGLVSILGECSLVVKGLMKPGNKWIKYNIISLQVPIWKNLVSLFRITCGIKC